MTIEASPSDMLVFATVVREGGFTRAARRLGVTKQTVSERIARLEGALEVRLLERSTRRVRPTDIGAAYYARCAAIAAQIEEANNEVTQRTSEPVGLLRVSSPYLYGRRFLGRVVTEFIARYPKTRIEITLADRRVNLIDEGFDLAIRIGELDDSSLTARKLSSGHMYYVASPTYLARHSAPDPATLRGARCVGMQAHETWKIRGVNVKVEPVLVVNDLEIVCDAAIAGVGVARLPSLVCREAVRDGRLRVLFDDESMLRPVYVVYPSRAYLPAKVRLFIDALAELVEPMQPITRSERAPHRR
ncbi:MAG: LysR family transcriptional regulator [Myxococcales bacterium]|nr:LysR family transcriptional regulator [Myxococcales bacterium]